MSSAIAGVTDALVLRPDGMARNPTRRPTGQSAIELSRDAADAGLVVPAIASYCAHEPKINGVVIGFASTAPDVSSAAIRTLAQCQSLKR
jgi:DNA-binding transcriptional MocR family regulator